MKKINILLICLFFKSAVLGQILNSHFNTCDYKPLVNYSSYAQKSTSDTIAYNTFNNINDWTISTANLQGLCHGYAVTLPTKLFLNVSKVGNSDLLIQHLKLIVFLLTHKCSHVLQHLFPDDVQGGAGVLAPLFEQG